jgi:hypothetical protein
MLAFRTFVSWGEFRFGFQFVIGMSRLPSNFRAHGSERDRHSLVGRDSQKKCEPAKI